MGLAVDAREYQHANSRLVRQAQQLSLPREENVDDMEMQRAHLALVDRFATLEKYIWEFIDRIESRRRCLQASIIFFSEAAVVRFLSYKRPLLPINNTTYSICIHLLSSYSFLKAYEILKEI